MLLARLGDTSTSIWALHPRQPSMHFSALHTRPVNNLQAHAQHISCISWINNSIIYPVSACPVGRRVPEDILSETLDVNFELLLVDYLAFSLGTGALDLLEDA